MSHRWIAGILLVISLGAILIGYLLLHPELVLSCPAGAYSNCISESWDLGVGSPLFWSTRLLPILFFCLIFVRPEVFKAWAKVFVPLAVIAFIGIAGAPPVANPIHLEIDRTRFTEIAVEFLVAVSAVVIAWKYWRLSRRKSAA